MKVVYLASPFSSSIKEVEDYRYKTVTKLAARLMRNYEVALITPITSSYNIKQTDPDFIGTDFEFWKEIDLAFVSRSDEVWVAEMDGWKDSIGVREEIRFALSKGIRVRIIDMDILSLRELYASELEEMRIPNIGDHYD
jgi:hypothetical protein